MTPLNSRQEALLSASARHVNDARSLLTDSPDQAWHLAGFGPECVRKACLEDGILDLALGHDLGPNGDVLLDWWIPLDPSAWRYRLSNWADDAPLLAEWSPNHRYKKTGTFDEERARLLTEIVGDLLDSVVADLWSDGRLREGPV